MTPEHSAVASPDSSLNMHVSVAVPVYNNEGSLTELNDRLKSVLASLNAPGEIVYVNDGSTDDSLAVLTGILAAGSNIRVVNLDGNFGQSSAILAAMSVAAGDIVVTIDADLENHPEDIPRLVAAIEQGAELVCGLRRRRDTVAPARRIASWIANQLVARGLGVSLKDWGCGLNAVRKGVTRQILQQDPLPTLPKIEAALLASSIVQVDVAFSDREHGPSGYTFWRLAGFAVAFFRSFSTRRSLRRLWTARNTQGDSEVTTTGAVPGLFRRIIDGLLSVIAWSILSLLALLVRIGMLLSGSWSKTERFRIRTILN